MIYDERFDDRLGPLIVKICRSNPLYTTVSSVADLGGGQRKRQPPLSKQGAVATSMSYVNVNIYKRAKRHE